MRAFTPSVCAATTRTLQFTACRCACTSGSWLPGWRRRPRPPAGLGDRAAEGRHLGNLGLAYADLGETRRAIEYYEQALAISREIGDRRGEGSALNNLGEAFKTLGQHAAALACYRLAVAVGQAIEDPRVEGRLKNIEELKEAIGAERFAALEREVAGREEAVLAEALERMGGRGKH